MSIRTSFPPLNREELVGAAQSHAALYGEPSEERAAVNFLRHVHTDYDEEPSQARHEEACRAIAAAYPWLAAECERQIARRAKEETAAAAAVRAYEAERACEQEERRALAARSQHAISGLAVGQQVLYRVGSRSYTATITKLGRSKVTLTYRLKTSGAERTKQVYAALVDPVEGEEQ